MRSIWRAVRQTYGEVQEARTDHDQLLLASALILFIYRSFESSALGDSGQGNDVIGRWTRLRCGIFSILRAAQHVLGTTWMMLEWERISSDLLTLFLSEWSHYGDHCSIDNLFIVSVCRSLTPCPLHREGCLLLFSCTVRIILFPERANWEQISQERAV